MSTSTPDVSVQPAAPRPLRIWPVIALFALIAATRLVMLMPEASQAAFMFMMFAPALAGIGLLLWWTLGSRATATERWLGPLAVVAVAVVAYLLLHMSNQGMGAMFYFVPSGVAAVCLALILVFRARPGVRLWAAAVGAVIGFGAWDLARVDGMTGDYSTQLTWRWRPTAEDQFLADLKKTSASPTVEEPAASSTDEKVAWSEFRGPNRDARVPGIVLDGDWKAHPPKEIWRRKVGPGWSSFSAAGRSLFTQEQRGDVEVVACYDMDTGAPRWTHESTTRFWEAAAGAGPRATPTLAGGKLFSVGATGLVHCLEPATGKVIWQRDLSKDAKREPLMWGFSSSPLIVDDLVIVYAGGEDDRGVFAYDMKSGEPRWQAPAGDHSYSSPQRATIDGADYVLMLTNTGISAISPRDGTTAWNYEWPFEGYRVIQPLVLDGSSLLLGTGMGAGTRRIDVTMSDGKPQIKERWTSLDIKPDFNDYVAHKGCLYGFDHNIFACIDLETGKRNWKKGRYGNGQVLLLPDADQLLVLSETGEVILLRANPDKLEELATTSVLKDKTWNHPILVGNRLFVRNGEEAVCLELPLAEGAIVVARQ